LLAPISQHLKREIEIPEAGKCRVTIPFNKEFTQNSGLLHGALVFEIADTAGFIAANSTEQEYSVLTAAFNINFFRPVASGIIIAEATVIHRGKSLIVCTTRVTNENQKPVAEGNGTYQVSNVLLATIPGYDGSL
jgi:uncharacterized protein (TIGR00369 family)